MRKRKIMKSRSGPKIPRAAVWLLAVATVLISFRISGSVPVNNRFACICSVTAMPDSIPFVISSIKAGVTARLGIITKNKESIDYGQPKDTKTDMNDLTVTPSDILSNMKNADTDNKNNDGRITEKLFIEDQATDSFGNVHIRNITENSSVHPESILSEKFTVPDTGSEPALLIYHTHSSETYILSDSGGFSSSDNTRSDNIELNMIRIGDEMTRVLKSKGINVIHDREIHDTVYTGAYDVSRKTAEEHLNDHPSIYMTLDVHRDSISISDNEKIKPTAVINGKKAAQIMIITGAEGGNVENFQDWEKNLTFAVNLQKAVNDRYEHLMKPIFFCNRKYNMDLTSYSLLIEIGTDVNTLEEAAYSARLFADALADFINDNKGDREK